MDSASVINIPSKEECQKLVESFVELTGTNEAIAQFFLQVNWNLEHAVGCYFDQKPESVAASSKETDDITVTFDSGEVFVATTKPPSIIRFLSWNIDGIEETSLKIRMKAAVQTISSGNYDIIHLQEVTPVIQKYFEEHLPEYMFIPAHDKDYYVVTLLRVTTVCFDNKMVHPFSNSVMGRNLLEVEAHIGSIKLRLLNTHLESTAEFSDARKVQLMNIFRQMVRNGENYDATLLAGDLNIRDHEVQAVGMPYGCNDLWVECGMRKECQYTWDLSRNTNKSVGGGKFQPRCRFDRAYMIQKGCSLEAIHFGLDGISKIAGTNKFPSDHWAIQLYFEILDNSSKPAKQANITRQMIRDTKFHDVPEKDIEPEGEIVVLD